MGHPMAKKGDRKKGDKFFRHRDNRWRKFQGEEMDFHRPLQPNRLEDEYEEDLDINS